MAARWGKRARVDLMSLARNNPAPSLLVLSAMLAGYGRMGKLLTPSLFRVPLVHRAAIVVISLALLSAVFVGLVQCLAGRAPRRNAVVALLGTLIYFGALASNIYVASMLDWSVRTELRLQKRQSATEAMALPVITRVSERLLDGHYYPDPTAPAYSVFRMWGIRLPYRNHDGETVVFQPSEDQLAKSQRSRALRDEGVQVGTKLDATFEQAEHKAESEQWNVVTQLAVLAFMMLAAAVRAVARAFTKRRDACALPLSAAPDR